MTIAPDLKRDAREHGVRLAAQQPTTVYKTRIRWTGRRWVLQTSLGRPIGFAADPQALRRFARSRFWDRPSEPLNLPA